MRKVKEVFDKVKSNKKITIATIGLLITLILTWGGVTYSLFNYTNDNAGNNDINSGHISMTYTEPSNEYVVENALPIKDAEGMNSTNYFEFSVTTKVKTNDTDDEGVSIPYEISITESEDNTLTNDKIKMYVTEVEGEKELDHTVPTLVSYFEPSLYKNGQIKVGFNLHLHRNGNETVTTKYRLRAWIDYDTDVSDWDTAGEFVYKFRVNVNGEATYQGYETDQSCFAYEENANGNYSITGYDFASCSNKNIVVPKMITVRVNLVLENIIWVSDEEFIESYKNYVYEQGMCSSDVTWNDCLSQNNTSEEELLAQYPDLKTDFNTIIGYEKSVLEDEEILDSLNMFVNMGICTLEWSEGDKITVKIDTIKSFSNTAIAAVSNKNDVYSANNLNNVIRNNKSQAYTMADITQTINGLIISDDITIEFDAFKNLKVEKIIDKKGKFPTSCFEYKVTDELATITDYKCQGVEKIKIPSQLDGKNVLLEKGAFSNNDLESVYIPNSVTVNASPFEGNNIRTAINENGDFPLSCLTYFIDTSDGNAVAYLDKYKCKGIINVDIPAKINDAQVVYIIDKSFTEMGLVKVTLPDGLLQIGYRAFYNNQLEEIEIPDSITDIHGSVFANNSLKHVKLPAGLKTIDSDLFYHNKLETIDIPDSVTTIRDTAFANNQLTNVKIPDSVTGIGYQAFESNKLKSVIIGNSVRLIGNYAFQNNQLTSVEIPDSVTCIGNNAFQNNQLTNVIIGDGVQEIEAYTFQNNQLTNVIIGNNVQKIGDYAFESNKLTNVNIPDSVTLIRVGAFKNNQLTNVKISGNVTYIGDSSFENNKLISVEIPDSVTYIGSSAFAYNKLKNVTIPSNVTSIGGYAFYKNKDTNPNLSKIINLANIAFNWNNIINGASSTSFVTGTVTNNYGNVEILSE